MTLSRLFARRSLFVSLSLVMLLAFAIVPAALAGTIVVDANCTDTNLATAVCDDNTTYRTIAGAAAAATAGDTLDVQTTGGHTEAGVTLTKTLTIQGQGQNTTIWQAATGPGLATTRLFTVNPGVAITVTGLTLQYGIATDGGAIYNLRGTLMLSSVNVFTNTSSAGGGAIYNVSSTAGTTATVHITGSVFSGNRSLAFPGGGALTTFTNNATARGVAVITNTQFISNNSSYQGGAILSDANSGTTSLFVTGSTFTRNTTTNDGGAIISFSNGGTANLAIASSVFISNTTGSSGGAVSNFSSGGSATATIAGSQFMSNTAGYLGGAVGSFGNFGSASLTLSDSQFSYNSASGDGGALVNFGNNGTATATITNSDFYTSTSGSSGGAIANVDNGGATTLTLQSSEFISNTAVSGGALSNQSGYTSATLVVTDSVFLRNRSTDNFSGGGAVANSSIGGGATAKLTVTSSQFLTNTSLAGGGAIDNDSYSGTARATLTSSQFNNNTAAEGGGAFYNHSLDEGSLSELHVISSTVANNTAVDGGGALAVDVFNRDGVTTLTQAQSLFTDTVVYGNRATGSSADGGAIWAVGTSGHSTGTTRISVTLFNTTLFNNSAAGTAGGIYTDISTSNNLTTTAIASSYVTLTHVTIYSNTATSGSGALYIDGFDANEVSRADLFNTLISGNSGSECSGSGTLAGTNNDIDDTTCGSSSPFRLASAEGTVQAVADNGGPTYTSALTNTSPAVDAASVTYCPAADQRGTARPQGSACDIGAHEGVYSQPTLILDADPPDGNVGIPYTYTFTANGFPLTYTLQAGTLPPGLTLGTNGVLSGTPTTIGTYGGLVVRANNGLGFVDSSAISIAITQVITLTATPPDGRVGQFYTYTLTANYPALTYTVQSGTLPPGLTLNANGVLSGTPTLAGTFSGLVFRASSGQAFDDSASESILITETVTLTANPPDGQVGQFYTHTLTGTGTTPITFTVQSGSLPPGLTLSSGGVLSGTPTLAGTYSGIVFRANNGWDTDDSSPQTIIITQTVTISANPPDGAVDVFYSYQLGGTGNPITYTLQAGTLPPGLTLSSSGLLSGTPTDAGTYSNLVFRANNGWDTDDTAELDIVITGDVEYKIYIPVALGPEATSGRERQRAQ